MLRCNVGVTRKISRDYNSTGYSVNLDGEILSALDDAEQVLERVRELFDLAHEALDQEVERQQGEAAIGSHDEKHPAHKTNGSTDQASQPSPAHANGTAPGNGTPDTAQRKGTDEAATNKQVQFILNMSKRFKLSKQQLENRISKVVGRQCGVYDLTKKEAGVLLNDFTNAGEGERA